MSGNYHNELQQALSYEALSKALFERYESLCAVDVETGAYQYFHESDTFSALQVESCGNNFFDALERNLQWAIYPDDQEYVRNMMSKKALQAGMEKERYYGFVYRLMIDGEPVYHEFRATMALVNQRPHFLIGVRNVDAAFRLDLAQTEELSAMYSKQKNHLEAVLASAEGYMEANLSKDQVLELSNYVLPELPEPFCLPASQESLSYSDFEKWRIETRIVENKEKYIEISDRNYLIDCFLRGEKRASVSFSMKTADGQVRPCRKFFFLHQDEATGDILSFCVIYDLTEQQRKEKELRDLEHELQMSRIRNFTSQMQPHFLYNALGSIQEIVLDDPQYASDLLGDFTVHLRSCIRAMANDAPIPFEQELANVRAYVNIEKMRFGDKLKVIYDIKEDNFSILPLSVQPIVENAIRHGIYQRGEAGGTVVIRTAEKEAAWKITVEDTGVGFDVQEYYSALAAGELDSTGLKNIMFRLDKVMHSSLEIKSTVNVGTTVTITIPKEKRENESDCC
ncbi:MAG: histidine kinase [Oscillospiraceae bacterium]|nr:histidine kinase [Oscillospiraceae bacterium]